MSLINIQAELKSAKTRKNTFGGYTYRNCEDVLEAVKPLLAKYNAKLTLSDEVVEIGQRVYILAKASILIDGVVDTSIGYAREPETQKGMSESQITGSASSYARKFALSGLFLIDDSQDIDGNETHEDIYDSIKKSKSVAELTKIFASNTKLQKDEAFTTALSTRKAELA